MRPDENIDHALQLGSVLSYRPGELAAAPHRQVIVDFHTFIKLTPEYGDEILNNGDFYQPVVRHLDHVLILEQFIGRTDHHRLFSFPAESFIERLETFVIAAGWTHLDFFAGQVIQAGDRRRRRARHDNLTDVFEN